MFAALAAQYAYDPQPLNASIEDVDDSSDYWSRERVRFDTAYGEQMDGLLFLPKNARPPFQTVLYFPGAGSIGPRPCSSWRSPASKF